MKKIMNIVMKKGIPKNILSAAILSASVVALGGCFHDDDDDPVAAATATYFVSVTNVTNGQPITPLAVIAHHENYSPWMLGSVATTGLEMLAESGDPSAFIAEANASADVLATASSVNGPFGPGATETVTITAIVVSDMEISVTAMLANTNDAFTSLPKMAVGSMAVGDSSTMLARVYDAGTEAHTETAGTMPGPAAGGEGFNATRDDNGNFISVSAGVVTSDDGLATSALNESHRWLGAAAKVTVTRTK